MLRLFRAGSAPGRPAPVVRVVAALVLLGLVVAAAPFVAGALVWVAGLL